MATSSSHPYMHIFFFEMWFYSPSHEDVKSVSQHLALVSETITTMIQFSWVQLLSHDRLCNPMDCSMPGLPVHHHLPEFTQTHIHWVGDAIQPSHPLSSPFSSRLQSFPASGSFQRRNWGSSMEFVPPCLPENQPVCYSLSVLPRAPVGYLNWVSFIQRSPRPLHSSSEHCPLSMVW